MNFKLPFLTLLIALGSIAIGAAELSRADEPDLSEAIANDSRLTFVNFWATWCVPCVAELEDLRKLDESYSSAELTIVGVSLDAALPIKIEEASRRASKMLADKKIRYRNVLYTGTQRDLARVWDIDSGLPFSILLDSSGKVLATHRGRISIESILEEVREHLAGSPTN